MRFPRLPIKDPRTIAREIPGISNLLFPQLTPTIVAHLNKQAIKIPNCSPICHDLLQKSSTNAAMLFEVSYARAENIMKNTAYDWDTCFNIALARQSRYFDASLPEKLSNIDIKIAEQTADNLILSLKYFQSINEVNDIIIAPKIRGFHWISNSEGDFSLGNKLIEVKCTNKNFSASDYRQILIYWLLSYIAALEGKSDEWEYGLLLNPRLNHFIEFNFSELLKITSIDRNKIEIYELFSSLINTNLSHPIV